MVRLAEDTDFEWFANGPTTHLTDDGDTSLCGEDVPEHVTPKPVEGGEHICGGCANIAGW